ncbi:MAG TPA: glycogen debranching N-terminal domain-containing protein [Acidocella sp.]|nr:glycogen debranching N-terminal domain-containing protein [Acidocella sp.]
MRKQDPMRQTEPADLSHSAVGADAARAEDRPQRLKADETFAVFGPAGDIARGAEGLYHGDTRHLSRLVFCLNGAPPRLLSASTSADNATLHCDRAARAPEGRTDMDDDGNEISLRVETFLWRGCRHDRITVTNWSTQEQPVALEIRFESDFADLFEIRGSKRVQRGTVEPARRTDDGAVLAYCGRDGVRRWTRLACAPEPDETGPDSLRFERRLAPLARYTVTLASQCGSGPAHPEIAEFTAAQDAARAHRRVLRRQAGVINTGNALADAALRRARDDLIMLTTATPYGPFPFAGVPWYATPFGRDALITALLVIGPAPALARGVLGWLAANQATEHDAAADSEPGKILHEARDGEMARCGEVPFRRYYGSVDATPLFVMLAGAYLARTGDTPFLRGLWPNIVAALGWIDGSGDADGDGFVEYGRRSAQGLVNQGWKDSQDSVFHADGTLARGPIALCEVQGYVFAAKRAAAEIAQAIGEPAHAAALSAQAGDLQARFDAVFWDEELQFYALALDGQKHPCRVVASNAGHALFTGIALPARAGAVAERLMGAEFFSGFGIRTLARGQKRYNPMSYHNGSVWPHDTALIGLGLARYGRAADTARLFDGLLAAAAAAERLRLPELFCGFPRAAGRGPVSYPVACAPQAWAAAALPALLDACVKAGCAIARPR